MIFPDNPISEAEIDSCQLRGNIDCEPKDIMHPKFKPNCCTEGSPCGLGEGACSGPATCMQHLVCGNDNCDKEGGGKTNCCTTPWDIPGYR